ncbi:MAG: bifunctional enoyl-CoA hydratase/phosphate acetyltransferase [Smithellaceae bacterium]
MIFKIINDFPSAHQIEEEQVMGFNNFNEMIKAVGARKNKKRCAVVAAESEHTLEAVIKAYKEGIIEPILIGDERLIKKHLGNINGSTGEMKILPTSSHDEAAQKAVDLVHAGKADCLMKGLLDTGTMMRAVLSDKNKLRTGKIVSVMTMMEIPTYHKLLAMTDGAITLYPDLNQKKSMIENAVEALRTLGIPRPKVAVMAALETVNPRMPDTVDAAKLKEMNKKGEIENCIVEGPISYDLAISREAAQIKEYESPVAGDADLLLWPDITSGNLASKALMCSCRSMTGACVLGTKVPIIISSRSATTEEKYLSIVLTTAITENWGNE